MPNLAQTQVAAEKIEDLVESGTKIGDADSALESSESETLADAIHGAADDVTAAKKVAKEEAVAADKDDASGDGGGGSGIEIPSKNFAISTTDTIKTEGDTRNTGFTFTITRSGDATGTTSVDYAVTGSGGDQADVADFGSAFPSGIVNFADGETSKLVTVNVAGDTVFEADEGFTVTISDPGNSETITTSSAVGTIQNDDTGLAIAATSAVKAEGDSGTTAFTFTVTRSGDATGATSIDYTVTGSGSEQADAADFGGALPSGTVNFADGDTSKVVTVNVAGDTTFETDEDFTVTISNPGNSENITTPSATGTIQNDDTGFALSATDVAKAEGDTGNTGFTFTVTRSGDTTGATSVNYVVTGSGSDQADAADFGGALPSGTVNFADGETSRVVTVNVAGDTAVEADEGFSVTISDPGNSEAITTSSATGTIQNDDTGFAIATTDAAKAEGDSETTKFTFTVIRSGDNTTGDSSVKYAVTGSSGNQANAADFGGALPSGTVNFINGETSKVITVNVTGENTVEADEGFTVTISDPGNSETITTPSATGTIQNDDTEFAIAATDAAKTEGDSGTTAFTFTVTRSGNTTGEGSVAYAVTGSAGNPANAADFDGGVLPSGTVNFADGDTSKIVTIKVAGDSSTEPDEAFTVTLSEPENGNISTATATGTIEDNDINFAIEATNAAQPEGDLETTAFTFTITKTGVTTETSSVDYTVTGTGDHPAAAEDFGTNLPSGTITFEPGGTLTQVVTINISGETDLEFHETFAVMLSNPVNNESSPAKNATITEAQATGTIENDDKVSLAVSSLDGSNGFRLNGIDEYDYSGQVVSNAGDMNNDGFDDFIICARGGDGVDNLKEGSGESYVVFGGKYGVKGWTDSNSDLERSSLNLSDLKGKNGFRLYGVDGGDKSGGSADSLGDVNGDGYDDIVIGAYLADPYGNSSGETYVVFGGEYGVKGWTDLNSDLERSTLDLSDLKGDKGFRLDGVNAEDQSGRAVSSAGDMNGDGFDDILIGAYQADVEDEDNAGNSYVIFGGSNGVKGTDLIEDGFALKNLDGKNGIKLTGIREDDHSGRSVSSAGDINRDGYDDILIGAYAAESSHNNPAGEVYVVYGGPEGIRGWDNRDITKDLRYTRTLGGIESGDSTGWSVSSAGDMNGDGWDDILIGARSADPSNISNAGRTYVVFGGNSYQSFNLESLDDGWDGFWLDGIEEYDSSGESVSSAGDVNGDGFDDILIKANSANECYVVFGGANGIKYTDRITDGFKLSDIDGINGFKLDGISSGYYASGKAVSNAGDVNGDGFDDILIGSSAGDAGKSYIIFGESRLGSASHEGVDDFNQETLTGDENANTMVGGLGNDILLGQGGADVLYGGSGDDILTVTDNTFLKIKGGTGIDTLKTDGFSLNLRYISNNKVQGIEKIDMTDGSTNTLTLKLNDVLNLSDSTNTLIITGDGSDTVTMYDNSTWTKGETSDGYDNYSLGEAILLIGTNINTDFDIIT